MIEIRVLSSEVALALPDPATLSPFKDLVDVQYQPLPPSSTNGNFSSMRPGRRGGRYTHEDDAPEVQLNGVYRTAEASFNEKKDLVTRHLQSLADDTTAFIRPANGSKKNQAVDDEEWTVNLLTLQQFIRMSELERIVERKYGADALRLLRVVVDKHHVDQDQVPSHIPSTANFVV